MKIQKKKIGGGGGGGGWVGLEGGQGGCERRIEVFEKIHKKKNVWGVGRVDVNEELKKISGGGGGGGWVEGGWAGWM